jgi:uncharacterized membrane protein (UPF0127 family)
VITIKAKNCSKILDKSLGLIGKTTPQPIFFKTRFGIHTLGLLFPIDVMILDDNFKVTKLKSGLKPNKIFLWNPKFENVLELPEGWIKKKKIKLGKQIKLLLK